MTHNDRLIIALNDAKLDATSRNVARLAEDLSRMLAESGRLVLSHDLTRAADNGVEDFRTECARVASALFAEDTPQERLPETQPAAVDANAILTASLDTYREANRKITLASLLLLAQGIRADYGDSAQAFVTEWSDQGDWLSGCLTVERGPEGSEEYDDQDDVAVNLDGGSQGTWQEFAENTHDRTDEFRFDVAHILRVVPGLLANGSGE